MAIVVGNAEMYIITTKEICTAGWRSDSEVIVNPAVRVDATWNNPLTRRL